MKTLSKLIFVILSSGLFISQGALADPIQDNLFQVHKAGWFKSIGTPCPQVCKRIKGSIAEFEGFYAPQLKNKRTHVCKAATHTSNPSGKGWLYGNNFSSPGRNKICMVSTPSGRAKRERRFYCLCVIK